MQVNKNICIYYMNDQKCKIYRICVKLKSKFCRLQNRLDFIAGAFKIK